MKLVKKVLKLFGLLALMLIGYLAGYQAGGNPYKQYEAAYEQCMYLNRQLAKTATDVCSEATYLSGQVKKTIDPTYPIYRCTTSTNPFNSSSTLSAPGYSNPGYLP